ncbi:MAG: hypothetical protein Q9227_005048 [Pyrenula ochraceoflavens]
MRHRVMFADLALTFITGFPNFVGVVIIPQRSQLISNASPLHSSLPLLPLLGLSAVSGFLGGAASSRKNNTKYTILLGMGFQTLGLGLLSSLSTDGTSTSIPASLYGYTTILGFGLGMTLSTVTIIAATHAPPTFLGASQGAIAQARALGGSIGVAVATIILNQKINADLGPLIPKAELLKLHAFPTPASTFPPKLQERARVVYADAFNEQMRVLTWITLAGCLMSGLVWERNPPPPGVGRGPPGADKAPSISRSQGIEMIEEEKAKEEHQTRGVEAGDVEKEAW